MSGGSLPTKTGKYVGTGAAQTLDVVGFKPKYIKFVNAGTGAVAEYVDTMDDDAIVTHDSGTDAVVTSQGVTLEANGFAIGTNAVINGSGNHIHWMAIA